MQPRSSAGRAASASCAGPAPATGKRGGIRAIYFWRADPGAIYTLTAYAKADRDDLTAADRKALARLVTEIEREGGGR